MKMKTIKIIIPDIPPSLNQILRMHYHKRDKENKRWAAIVAMFDNRRKKIPLKKAKVKITYFFPDKRRRDPDNYSPKFIMDGLVAAAVIEDDSFDNVELTIIGKVDRQEPRTEIEVTDEP